MPPRAKVTRQMILDAAIDIIRERGHESLNVRAIAERLGCSTQPVLYSFKTVDEIREAAYQAADAYHSAYILPAQDEDTDPLLAMGLNYVRFGHEEKNLFRFLFQTNKFGGMDLQTLVASPDLAEVLAVVSQGTGVSMAEARELLLTFFALTHGLASLLANNAVAYDEAQCIAMLECVYAGALASQRK